MSKSTITVRILTPRQILYEGQALQVSSTNSQGRFDILPEHANFITLIEDKAIEIKKIDHKMIVFGFSQAIIVTMHNKVTVYADPQSTTNTMD
jgi:F0F1-type ATP synthase epsilon subunit